MVDLEEGRERLQAVRGGFSLRRTRRTLSRRSLGSLIESSPEAVSPNVLLRPVVESYLFPNLAYVGGPGELAYLGQLEGLFKRHGTARPIAFPRASLMVVEAKVERVLEWCGIEPDELRDRLCDNRQADPCAAARRDRERARAVAGHGRGAGCGAG